MSDDVLRQLPTHLAADDLGWLRRQLDAGQLSEVRTQLDEVEWQRFVNGLAVGDPAVVKDATAGVLLGDGVTTVAAATAEQYALLRQVPERFVAHDGPWLYERYLNGDLDGLRWQLSEQQWHDLGVDLRDGNLSEAEDILAPVRIPGVGTVEEECERLRGKSGKRIAAAVAALVLIGLVIAGLLWAAFRHDNKDLAESLADAGNYDVYLDLMERAGLSSMLEDNPEGGLTVFPPTDAAFDAVPADVRAAALNDINLVRQILLYHSVPDTLQAEELTTGPLETSEGQPIEVTVEGDTIRVNDATVIQTDIQASNGVAQGIDKVLVPPDQDLEEAKPTQTIAQIVATQPQYSTLNSLLGLSGLEETLNSTGPFTLFAPTNDAIARLPADQVKTLQENPALLNQVLQYHVVPGQVLTAVSAQPGRYRTLEGSDVTVSIDRGVYQVNGALVVDPDGLATNGTVEGIDRVLVPPGLDLSQPPSTTAAPTTTTVAPTTTAPAPTTTVAPTTTAAPTTTTVAPTTTTAPAPTSNVMQVLEADPATFSTLVQVIDQAGLRNQLTTQPVTFLAPTNDAFEALGLSLDELLALDTDELRAILDYHQVVSPPFKVVGDPTSEQEDPFEDGDSLVTKTPGQQRIAVTVQRGEVRFNLIVGTGAVNNGKVTDADLRATNGVVQGIDRILLPPGTPVPTPLPA